jgi:hypothetical protein
MIALLVFIVLILLFGLYAVVDELDNIRIDVRSSCSLLFDIYRKIDTIYDDVDTIRKSAQADNEPQDTFPYQPTKITDEMAADMNEAGEQIAKILEINFSGPTQAHKKHKRKGQA